MTKTPHKHAELIKAWADGAVIQYLDTLDNNFRNINTPSWDTEREYRVKPTPEPVYPTSNYLLFGMKYSKINSLLSNELLKIFVMSGDLATYVEQYGVDGLKGQQNEMS